jgi:hypothetical protein
MIIRNVYADRTFYFETVLEAAKMYRAEELEKFLRDFKENNGMLLDILISKESQ